MRRISRTRLDHFASLVWFGTLLLGPPGVRHAAAQEALWVGRLGTDTVVVEGARQVGSRIEGTIVNVAAGLTVQRYEADLDPDGNVRSLRRWTLTELTDVSPADSAPTLTVEIGSDSIRVTRAGRDGTEVTAVPSIKGAVPVFDPFFNNPMALMDLALRATGRRGDGIVRLYYVGSPNVDELPLRRTGSGEVSYPYALALQYPMMAGARLYATVDDDGMFRFDARETTLKIVTQRGPWSDPLALARQFERRGLGAGGIAGMSPPRAASGRVSTVQVDVTYGQPSRRGRRIFPDVVPFGTVWRAGANAATEISFSADVLAGGNPVPTGSYSVWVIPGETADTLILNKATQIWGTMYDAEQDLVRIPVRTERVEEPIESLTYSITGEAGAGRLELAWGDRRLSVSVEPADQGRSRSSDPGPDARAPAPGDAAPAAPEAAGSVELGDVVAANLNDGSVARFDGRTGEFRGYLVPPGTGGLAGATGVTFGPDGDLYVGSSRTDQVLRYDGRTGEFRGPFVDGGELAGPFSLIFGPDGDLYVSSSTRNEVLRFDGDTGAFGGVAAADSTLTLPIGLRFGPDGLLYVANAGGESVDRYDPETGGLVDRFATGIRFASDLDFGPDGDLYVSSAAAFAVLRFDGRTDTLADTAVVLPDSGVPVGLAFAGDGRLFISDFVQSRLFVLEPGATEATLLSTEGLAGPENVAVVPVAAGEASP